MSLPNELKSACPGLRTGEPLSRHTSLQIGGPADYYAEVNTREELIGLRRAAQAHSLPVFFIGAGSNLLVSDKGMRGLVVHLQGDFKQCQWEGTRVKAGAAVMLPTIVRQCADRGLTGIEALIGVPGTVGGGLVMNAGTRDGVLGDVVESVETLNEAAQIVEMKPQDLRFDYRRSNLEGHWILGATLRLNAGDRSSIIARIDEYLAYRTRTQPLTTSNCGSVFKNPPGNAAARLVEQAGFKGKRVGGAQVSERHANFILNNQNAKASDVQELMRQIQETVLEKFGIRLEPEVKLVGDW